MGRVDARDQGCRGRETGTGRSRRRLWPAVMALEGRALLSTLTVTNTDDSGAGSLRAAVAQANADGGDDTIVFSSLFNTPQTITLTGGTLELTDTAATTITGPGANMLTISGNTASGVFQVEGGSAALSGLTVTKGRADRGAGVLNQGGTLSLTSVTVSGNVALDEGGGVDTQFNGTSTLMNCTISGNSATNDAGGGVANLYNGSASLSGCTVSGNSAPTGGGVANLNGTLTMTTCTVSGNSATVTGGGLVNNGATFSVITCTVSANSAPTGDGGGLANLSGNLALTNSSITGNSAQLGGGLNNSGGTTTLSGCTVSGNKAATGAGLAAGGGTLSLVNATVSGNTATGQGGGLYVERGTATLTNDTVSANSAATGGGLISSGSTAIVMLTNTIVAGQTTGGDIAGKYTGSNNLIGGNPLLAPLFDFGGPTLTMPPLPASPAIGMGTTGPGVPTMDQRGFARGASVDIGAFQTQGAASMEVNVTTDGPGSGLGQLDLRQAINLANAQPGDNTVSFDPSVFGTTPQTITLTQGQIGLGSAGSPTVAGPGPKLLTINGNNASRVFLLSGTRATLSGLTITGGTAQWGGGVANYSGTLSMTGCFISGNTTTGSDTYEGRGGGLLNSGTMTLTDCTISGNSSHFSAAGLLNELGGTLALTNCTVSGNAAYQGGGMANYGNASLINCTVVSNSATGYDPRAGHGGGILSYSSLNVLNTIVAGNRNGDIQGSYSGTHNLVGGNPMLTPMGDFGGPTSTIAPLPGSPAIGGGETGPGVPATDQRGFARGASIDIGAFQTQSALVVNVATDVANAGLGQLTMRNAFNIANARNSAVAITFDPGVFGTSPVFTLTGGPLVLTDKSSTTITAPGTSPLTITAGGKSRVFDIEGGTAALAELTITGGSADLGAGLFVNGGTLSLTDCTVSGNTATRFGGGVYSKGAAVTLVDSTVSGNSALEIGGGVYSSNGTLVLTDATVSGNSAVEAGGGGVNHNGGTAAFTNSTFSGNTAWYAGGLFVNKDTATITNCTISGNTATGHLGGGGLYTFAATPSVTNTIVAGNINGDTAGKFTGSNNLIGGDPLLSPLGQYGGPTATMGLLPGSPAIGAGAAGPGNLITDQRGVTRVDRVDIGAFQSQGFALLPVALSTPQSAVAGDPFANELAIKVMANDTLEPVDGGVITYASPTAGASATLSAATANIVGGTAFVTATANSTLGSYIVTASVDLALPTGFALTNTQSFGSPGPIPAPRQSPGPGPIPTPPPPPSPGPTTTPHDAALEFHNLASLRAAIAFANNHPGPDTITFDPDAPGTKRWTIRLTGGPLVLTDPATTTINGPGARLLTLKGDGKRRIFDVRGGSLALSGVAITGGRAERGGGIRNDDGTLSLTDVVVRNNSARKSGGGLFNSGTATLTDVTVRGNHADVGGNVANFGTLSLTRVTMGGNSTRPGTGFSSGLARSLARRLPPQLARLGSTFNI